jgi:peptide/nickel transport system permease protein
MAVGLGLVCSLALVALLAPLLAPYDPEAMDVTRMLERPSGSHLFGTDQYGRDILSRVMYAYRVSLVIAFAAVGLATVVGVIIGLLTGYFGGLLDQLLMRPVDIVMAFPVILFAIILIAAFGTGTSIVIVAIGTAWVPVIARIMRSSALSIKQAPYVDAARARGAGHLRVMVRHILPNAPGPIVIQASILLGFTMLTEAALSFLGLGPPPPTPSLGRMLSEGRDYMHYAPWAVIFPGLGIALAVLGYNLLGDGLRDLLDPTREG